MSMNSKEKKEKAEIIISHWGFNENEELSMFKYFVTLFLTLTMTATAFAGNAQLVDFILGGNGVKEILVRYGIKEADSAQVQSYVASSLMALGSKSSLTKAELKSAIEKLPVSSQDATIRKQLQVLLEKSEKDLKQEDVVQAINNLIYLANKHGKSIIITCAECVNENLAKAGFKFSVETIKNASLNKLLEEVIPKNPAELNTFISSRAKRLGFGDYSKVSPELVSSSEEKSLAIFLALAENGNADQKALTRAIKRISTKNGKTDMFDSKNAQKFWKILSDDMSPQDMNGWTKTLNEVAGRAERDGVAPEEAFYRTLKDKAQGNDNLMKQYETLKAKRCFFK